MTKEDLNKNTPSFTFSRSERLKSRKIIASLFRKRSYFNSTPLRVYYINSTEKEYNQVAFSVPKAKFKRAVDRNLLKRRMREAYRLNKNLLSTNNNRTYSIMFVFLSKEIESFEKIEAATIQLIKKIANLA
ncbi:MAG: ribonuclease P protein component [Chitinophagales bacterium]